MGEKLKEILSTVLKIEIDQIGPQTKAEHISSWDSLNHIKILTLLEDEFDIEFEDEQILRMNSFQEIHEILNALDQ